MTQIYSHTIDVKRTTLELPLPQGQATMLTLAELSTSKLITSSTSYIFEAFIYCEFDLYKKPAAGGVETRLKPEDSITLEHNWFRKLFTNIQLDVGSGTLESINNPGVYDYLIRYVKYNKSYTDTSAQIQGWIPDTNIIHHLL